MTAEITTMLNARGHRYLGVYCSKHGWVGKRIRVDNQSPAANTLIRIDLRERIDQHLPRCEDQPTVLEAFTDAARRGNLRTSRGSSSPLTREYRK